MRCVMPYVMQCVMRAAGKRGDGVGATMCIHGPYCAALLRRLTAPLYCAACASRTTGAMQGLFLWLD